MVDWYVLQVFLPKIAVQRAFHCSHDSLLTFYVSKWCLFSLVSEADLFLKISAAKSMSFLFKKQISGTASIYSSR